MEALTSVCAFHVGLFVKIKRDLAVDIQEERAWEPNPDWSAVL